MMTSKGYATLLIMFAMVIPVLWSVHEGTEVRGVSRFIPVPTNDLATLQVNVTLESGEPVPFIFVNLHSTRRNILQLQNKTDSEGRTNFTLSSINWGPSKVFCQYANPDKWWGRTDIFIAPQDVLFLDLVLEPELPSINNVSGKVLNSSSGAPIPGLSLQFMGVDAKGRTISNVVESDASGDYFVLLPNSTAHYSILQITAPFPDLTGDVIHFYLEPGVHEYDLDVPIKSKHLQENALEMTLRNSTTGSPVTEGTLSLKGYVSVREHAAQQDTFVLAFPDASGLISDKAPAGEYRMTWSYWLDEHNVSFSCTQDLVVNSTSTQAEMGIPLPGEYRRVTLWMRCAPDMVEGVYGSGDLYLSADDAEIRINFHSISDALGRMEFSILPDQGASIRLTRTGYDALYYDIPAGPSSSPYEATIDLVKTPECKVSVVVRDEVTDALVSYASVTITTDSGSLVDNDTDLTGRANFTVQPMTLRRISASSNLGYGEVKDVVVAEGAPTEVIVHIKGESLTDLPVAYGCFYLKDSSGAPVPGQQVSIRLMDDTLHFSISSLSDGDGKVRFHGPLGNYSVSTPTSFSSPGRWRNMWSWSECTFVHSSPGGMYPDIIVYPTTPLDQIEGSVRDSETGRPLMGAVVKTSSDLLDAPEPIHMYDQSIRSMNTGFYRTWGRDEVSFEVSRSGYFTNLSVLSLSTRAPTIYDIELTPIPPLSVWVNGTLVNEADGPITGYISVTDLDRHGQLTHQNVGANGVFNFHLYPGHFLIYYRTSDHSIDDEVEIEVETTDINGLTLKLVPWGHINGTVTDTMGAPLEGIEVVLTCIGGFKNGNMTSVLTGPTGEFDLISYKGTYMATVDWTESYNRYESPTLEFDGVSWSGLTIVLGNRSFSDISGKVLGDGGPNSSGIPGAAVRFFGPSGPVLAETVSDAFGNFIVPKVPYGSGCRLEALPPSGLTYVDWTASGYTRNFSGPLDVDAPAFDADIVLHYVNLSELEYLDVLEFSPTGELVPVDADIVITFSLPVDGASFVPAFSVDPPVQNIDFEWDLTNTTVTVSHDGFAFYMTYRIDISEVIRASNGAPLLGEPLNWTFRTAPEPVPGWELTAATVVVESDMDARVEAHGLPDMDLYIVIDGVGSFLVEEGASGEYSRTIPAFNFEWNSTYSYHFSNIEDGPDLSPTLSGTFSTPAGPVHTDDDDNGDDTVFEVLGAALLCVVLPIFLILVILVIIILILVVKRRSTEDEE